MVRGRDVAVGVAAAGGAAVLGYLLVREMARPAGGAVTPAPSGKTGTRMVVTVPPPRSVAQGQSFTFSGYLEDANGKRLANKRVRLMMDGSEFGAMNTRSDGTWDFGITIGGPAGTHTLYAEFQGDSEYEGC